MRAVILLAAALLAGCSSSESQPEPAPEAPSAATEPTRARDNDDPPRTIAGAPPGDVLELEPGVIARGRLETGDVALVDGSLGDDYGLSLAEGEAVTIVVRGRGGLDMQAILLFNGQDVASDDDGATRGDARNARIVFSPPVRGFYVLRVTTSGAGAQSGEYEVEVFAGGHLRQL